MMDFDDPWLYAGLEKNGIRLGNMYVDLLLCHGKPAISYTELGR
jgi:hypothetical protein